ncbi:unnamed protein product, partial [Linum tenue]
FSSADRFLLLPLPVNEEGAGCRKLAHLTESGVVVEAIHGVRMETSLTALRELRTCHARLFCLDQAARI